MADRRTVEDLSRANKELTDSNKQLTSPMEQINEKLDVITKLIQVIPTTGNSKKGGRGGTGSIDNITHIAHNIPSLNSTNNLHTAFLGSGASRRYIREDAPITISKKQDLAISVGQPGGAIMTSKYNCDLSIHSLPINT
eukprot:5180482-Ditylum_brightwellii.AAC.1